MTESSPGKRAPGRGLAPVATLSRRDAAANEIRRSIVLGHVKPGEKLTEIQMAEWLNVSRPTVREALNQVVQEGLVIQEPYRGLRVASMDDTSLIDLARTRMALDMLAIDGILADTSGRRWEVVEEGWRQYKQMAFDTDPFVQHAGHLSFHESIWAASENAMLLKLWPVTRAHMTLALAQDQAIRQDPERAYHVHEVLMGVLRSGDREAIKAALEEHTMHSVKELLELLTTKENQ
ncbi:GntR family transcriptional regulator [Glutamicibacter sp. NPDC087344]|uniref:GntR family transcriptional regulator n=1 Tax=Glutamicibacter sp. NPDC087344 TaxID=3363994 RepID=UPI0038130F66